MPSMAAVLAPFLSYVWPARDLTGLSCPQQGHKRQANKDLLQQFVLWYAAREKQWGNGQHGWPRLDTRVRWNTHLCGR